MLFRSIVQMNHTTREVEWSATPEMVAKFFTEMLKLNRASEMFNVCLAELGEIRKYTNGHYLPKTY